MIDLLVVVVVSVSAYLFAQAREREASRAALTSAARTIDDLTESKQHLREVRDRLSEELDYVQRTSLNRSLEFLALRTRFMVATEASNGEGEKWCSCGHNFRYIRGKNEWTLCPQCKHVERIYGHKD